MRSFRRHRRAAIGFAALLLLAVSPALVSAAGGPPPPTGPDGKPAAVVARGIPTPLAFAFSGSRIFVAAGGSENGKGAKGGLYTISGGKAKRVDGSPSSMFGLTLHGGVLYGSSGPKILSFRGFNGSSFRTIKTVFDGGKGFPGFNGLAVGPDGRLWSGTSLGMKYDHSKDPRPFAQSVVSLGLDGKGLRSEATGIRQPFQLVFVNGRRGPYVTDLAQDTKKAPPDHILHVEHGQNYGFPGCTHLVESACTMFATPLVTLPPHASPTGIAAKGSTLFVTLFGGLKGKPQVVSLSSAGISAAGPKPVMSGFVAPASAVGVHGASLYAGDLTGAVYRVTAP